MIEKYPAIIFLFCVCLIISWLVGRGFQRGGLHGNEKIDAVCAVASLMGGFFVVISCLCSLIQMIIMAWPK